MISWPACRVSEVMTGSGSLMSSAIAVADRDMTRPRFAKTEQGRKE
jgi:hypothetical protein